MNLQQWWEKSQVRDPQPRDSVHLAELMAEAAARIPSGSGSITVQLSKAICPVCSSRQAIPQRGPFTELICLQCKLGVPVEEA